MHASLSEVSQLLERFHALVAEGFIPSNAVALEESVQDRATQWKIELAETCRRSGVESQQAEDFADDIVQRLPYFLAELQEDVTAAMERDPAARSREEVEACYPGFRAIVAHRLAHALFLHEVPMLPRMISETAHRETGIDIHPGASIGRRFFIDHGTGVVIGEMTVIGDDVTLYQGVTIGALKLPRDLDGRASRGGKRHPTVGNRVVIYANATLLGGDTTIGDDCVIGAGAWLSESLQPGTMVLQEPPRHVHRSLNLPSSPKPSNP
jgi:serine O-acetyltransferase